MGFDAMQLLLFLAGGTMLAHVATSLLLRALVEWRSPLAYELFAVPNAAIAPDWGFRLLRAKYFLPWREPPSAIGQSSIAVRSIFLLARATGAAVPLLLLAFLAVGVYEGVH